MSQDLFAAFGESEAPRNILPTGASSPKPVDQAGDDDEFGDFEDASAGLVSESGHREPAEPESISIPLEIPKKDSKALSSKASTTHHTHRRIAPEKTIPTQKKIGRHPFAGHMDLLFEAGDDEYDAGADELGDISSNPEAAMAYSKRIIAEQEEAARKGPKETMLHAKPMTTTQELQRTRGGPNKLKKKSGYVPARHPDVLFDADNVSADEGEDDVEDFGEFEGEGILKTSARPKAAAPQAQRSIPAVDLIGLDDTSQTALNTNTNGIDRSTQQTESLRRQTNDKKPAEMKVQPSTQQSTSEAEDDAWDDFEVAAPPSSTTEVESSILSPRTATSSSLGKSTTSSKANDTIPPTNVPPPVILLSIFPSLFSAADDALFNALGKLDLKQKQMLLAHPASHQFLKGYLSHCTALAHIIAGRKQRWKRDQHLTQSMRIGPAAAGGKGGMKLAGIDKSELAKEDREVVDTLRLWKVQVGKLRNAVAAASATPGLPKLPSVPEISESAMPIKTLKPREGAISAPHACALCGLKREERVARVDGEVEDSFGEWWMQGLGMHLGCARFWEEFEGRLKSR